MCAHCNVTLTVCANCGLQCVLTVMWPCGVDRSWNPVRVDPAFKTPQNTQPMALGQGDTDMEIWRRQIRKYEGDRYGNTKGTMTWKYEGERYGNIKRTDMEIWRGQIWKYERDTYDIMKGTLMWNRKWTDVEIRRVRHVILGLLGISNRSFLLVFADGEKGAYV